MNILNIDRMRTVKAVSFAVILSSCAGWATDAAAEKSFFCKATIASIGDPGPVSLSGPLVYDMQTVGSCDNLAYATNFNAACKPAAAYNCRAKATGIPPTLPDDSYNSAAFWCGLGVPDGSIIRAYAGVGPPVSPKGRYYPVDTKGVLINKPEVSTTSCTCPTGWEEHEYPAGHKDGRCFQLACGPSTVRPFPEGPIGDNNAWGFTWGNGSFYAWGNAANGGAPTCWTLITSRAECRWQ
jgi:hypothetical protein